MLELKTKIIENTLNIREILNFIQKNINYNKIEIFKLNRKHVKKHYDVLVSLEYVNFLISLYQKL